MTTDEFEKIWRLLSSLFPSAAAKKSKVDIAVWRKGLEPYAMSEVSDQILTYAQNNKYFPDMADITKHLLRKQTDAEKAIIHNAKLLAKIKGIEPPPFETSDDAMDWYHELEATHEA